MRDIGESERLRESLSLLLSPPIVDTDERMRWRARENSQNLSASETLRVFAGEIKEETEEIFLGARESFSLRRGESSSEENRTRKSERDRRESDDLQQRLRSAERRQV